MPSSSTNANSQLRGVSYDNAVSTGFDPVCPENDTMLVHRQFDPEGTSYFYIPVSQIAINDLTSTPAPLNGTGNAALDVTVVSSDDVRFPSSRVLLESGSRYFKALFNSSFADSAVQEANVDLQSIHLQDVLHFICKGESPIITGINLRARELPPVMSRAELRENVCILIELGSAADFLAVDKLLELVGYTVTSLAKEFASITCSALSAILAHKDSALCYADETALKDLILCAPETRFGTAQNILLEQERPKKKLKSIRHRCVIPDRQCLAPSCSCHGDEPMCLDLSALAWRSLTESRFFKGAGTGSQTLIALEKWAKQPTTQDEILEERLRFATSIATKLNIADFDEEFLHSTSKSCILFTTEMRIASLELCLTERNAMFAKAVEERDHANKKVLKLTQWSLRASNALDGMAEIISRTRASMNAERVDQICKQICLENHEWRLHAWVVERVRSLDWLFTRANSISRSMLSAAEE